MTSNNYFSGFQRLPFHLSVGGVVVNDEGNIFCHYFDKFRKFENLYLLMHESINPEERIEECLARGLIEEFGAKGEIVEYLGPLITHFHHQDQLVEKTTLYFQVQLIEQRDEWRLVGDPEGGSTLLWLPPNELIDHMDDQLQRYGLDDLHESEIIKRLIF